MPLRYRRCHRRLDNRRYRPTLWKRLQPQRQSQMDGDDNLGSRTEICGNSHLSLKTRTSDLWKWCWRSGFEAHLKHHFKTVSSNINMLACSAYWSTIKTLPATLPEPSSENHGQRTEFREPRFSIPRSHITYNQFDNLGHRSALKVHRTQDRAARTSGLRGY